MTVPLERQKNIADVAARVREQLGLGTAAAKDVEFFASAEQGGKADTALQPYDVRAAVSDLSSLAIPTGVEVIRTTGYNEAGDGGAWPLAVEVPNTGTLEPWQRLTNGGTRRWELGTDDLDIRMLGAKLDGSDERAVLLAALRWQAEFGGWIDLPIGDLNVGAGGINWTKPIFIRGKSPDKSRILFDNFAATTPFIYGNASVSMATAHFKDFAVVGKWGDTSDFSEGQGLVYLYQYRKVRFENVHFKGSRSGGFVGEGVYDLHVTGSDFENMYRDALRCMSTRRAFVNGCKFTNICDDSIALQCADGSPLIDTSMILTGNTFVDSQGLMAVGAKNIIVMGNTFIRSMHRAICVGTGNAAFPTEGHNAVFNILVAQNVITDGFSGTAFSALSGAGFYGIWIEGLPFVDKDIVETYSGGDVVPPYPYLYTKNTDASGPNVGVINLKVSGNQILRTLDATSAYSNYGFGQRLSRSGWVDPAITLAQMMDYGIYGRSGGHGVDIEDNMVDGANKAVYLLLQAATKGASVRNFRFHRNQIRNWRQQGLNVNGNGFIEIDDCLFDGDPYHLHAERNADGSWSANFIQHQGIVFEQPANTLYGAIRGTTFKNIGIPFHRGGFNPGEVIWKNNLLVCDPAGFGYLAANKGIGFVPAPALIDASVAVEDGNPTSATFKRILNVCATATSGIPTSGKYVAGMFVRDASESGYLGWKRLTTGSGHVEGTDWRRVE